jgi:hypothetical protein
MLVAAVLTPVDKMYMRCPILLYLRRALEDVPLRELG